MLRIHKSFWTLFLLIASPYLVFAQNESRIYQDADQFMRVGNYDMAVEAFSHIRNLPDVDYKITICSLMSSKNYRIPLSDYLVFEGKKDPLFQYWLGKIYLKQNKTDEAKNAFVDFISTNKNNSKLTTYIEEATSLKKFTSEPRSDTKIELIESPLNSKYAEINGILFENGNKLIFASDRLKAGEFQVYLSEKGNYGWDAPKILNHQIYRLQTLNLLSNKNQWLIFEEQNKALQQYDLADNQLVKSTTLDMPDLTGAKHIYINKYRSRVIFSKSNRENGTEIYESFKLRSTGEWMDPVPISANINSTFDDDYPFLTEDRKQLYFSSNRPGGLGKMDIYVVNFYDDTNTWGRPRNLGLPINSADDDVDFKLLEEYLAMISSDRAGTAGDLDLFILKLPMESSALITAE